jgi:hypothetical protein
VKVPDDVASGLTATVPAAFASVWRAMAEMLGSAATAAIVRRAARRASAVHPALAQLGVGRKSFTPEYTIPSSWQDPSNGATAAREFQAFLDELAVLLRELTGAVVLRRLARLALPVGKVRPEEEPTSE